MEPEKTPRDRAEDLVSLLLGWRPTAQQGVWALRFAVVLVVLVAIGHAYDVTLLDWLKLLIVPAAIAGVGIWFNRQQRERELEIAERRTQDEALEAYLDQMGQLLLEKDRPRRQSGEDDEVRTLARARTLTLLSRLDRRHKRSVVQFLHESGLVGKERRVVDLTGADLSGADLVRANLSEADLSEAELVQAFLIGANLSGALLIGANLADAYLSGANLSGTDLDAANLYEANLSGVRGWTEDQLRRAGILEGATMPDGQILKGFQNPGGPTFEEWLKDRESRKEDADND